MATDKRDLLTSWADRSSKRWRDGKIFQANAPSIVDIPLDSVSPLQLRSKYPKFFHNFAFPYMNGTLHMGHAFTISKVEFQSGFATMQGKRTLVPLGFHCTGMPIKACADKLSEEVLKFGQYFEGYVEDHANGDILPPAPTQDQTKEDVTKFTSKKSKANAKSSKMKYQFQIMQAQGIPNEEIHKFADASYWLQYFPELCKRDMDSFGARVDWRRSFVTTDANLYYDSFVRWQMRRLKELEKIKFGDRYTVYSPKDGQPCTDHDRSEGEGVLPQEYTALKLKVREWASKAADLIGSKIPAGARVYFVPATLRPETMYGQTCCFVGPNIIYGIYKTTKNDYYVMTKRAAWNMAFQPKSNISDVFLKSSAQIAPIVEFPGSAVIGTLVTAPLSIHTQGIRILPMESVSATKGTGVVTCVASDSPDDWATIKDLAKKADYYGIQKEWADLEVPSLIRVHYDGKDVDRIAEYMVEKFKIRSPKDVKPLAEAKTEAYKAGFYDGKMIIGEFKGESVQEAKPKIKAQLIERGQAFEYAEPNGLVMSRSADECVVAYLGQWFLNYGEGDPEWRDTVLNHVEHGMEMYADATRNAFRETIGWLNRWACARTYGLGSKIPWDPKFLVESLSDSTIYMAYYTIAHFLHGDIFGTKKGIFDISPADMTDEVWDYIFCRREMDSDMMTHSSIKKTDLESMRREFQYWYPLDVRVSGKDLINNHLTFFLYVHIALFPKEYWPRGIRANGHLLLNGDKMSKSTGNFLTLHDAIEKYGVDATRIALADAGDGVDDANFDEETAKNAIFRCWNFRKWYKEEVKDRGMRKADSPYNIWEEIFENDINIKVSEAKQHYEATNYKLALQSAFFEMDTIKEFYTLMTALDGVGMHEKVLKRYIQVQALVMQPIAPHWAEYLWQEIHQESNPHPTTVQTALWPPASQPNAKISAIQEYMRSTLASIFSDFGAKQKKQKKGKSIDYDPAKPNKLTIFYTTTPPAWQAPYIAAMRDVYDNQGSIDEAKIRQIAADVKGEDRKKSLVFMTGVKKRLESGEKPEDVWKGRMGFDEKEVIGRMCPKIREQVKSESIEIVDVESMEGKKGMEGDRSARKAAAAATAEPGSPKPFFENV